MIVDVKTFDYEWFQKQPFLKRRKGNQGRVKKPLYKNLVCAFDIETTTVHYKDEQVGKEIKPRYQTFMYIWQFQLSELVTVVGRTWKEFNYFIQRIVDCLGFNQWLVVYVHNLSYEFQFLKGVYPFKPEEVFAVERRKILKCTMYDHIEFRCSYLQTNMSLAEFTKKMGAYHQKLDGDLFDYKKQRYPWTTLSDYEMAYCTNDVQGLVEALTIEMKTDGDTLNTIPLTSTGYIRRDTKKAMRKVNHDWMVSIQPCYEVYKLLREAFRGGDTHANRFLCR